ncbi:MAG TPA: Cu(I)-responsive transcriptional regulator [Burkholderiales bacterium]|nr:Cu(I)-responsive transcriptional regulator [Burkholderiales bacterium]
MNISQAAAASGVSAKMLRHYETIGLVPRARRTASNYRSYTDTDVHTLRFIRTARDLGFSIDDIRALLALWRDRQRPSREVKRLVERHAGGLRARIAELEAMLTALEHLARHCHGDERPDCPILNGLESGSASRRSGGKR